LIERGELRNWLFKSLSVESKLDDLEAEGVSVRAATDPAALQRVMSLDEFSSTIRRAAMSTLPAFLAFFCLENAVREIVVQRLTENQGSDWWDKAASKAVKDRVNQRREKEGKNRWHVQRGANEIYYTDFGDLLLLIQGNWPDFEDLFPDQHWIANRLNDLEASRNIIAHSNQLDEREIDRVKMYLHDWIRQVG
jgi:hypothetical protein